MVSLVHFMSNFLSTALKMVVTSPNSLGGFSLSFRCNVKLLG
jgi:hypothetical protein